MKLLTDRVCCCAVLCCAVLCLLPAGVWQQVHAQVQALQQPQGVVVPAVDGVTQMGMTHPLVSMLIQVGHDRQHTGRAGCHPQHAQGCGVYVFVLTESC
jgi:hypothetical protein